MKFRPKRVLISGKVYRRVLFRIQNTYENGQPEEVTMLPDKQMVEINNVAEHNQFFIGYVLEHVYNGPQQEAILNQRYTITEVEQ